MLSMFFNYNDYDENCCTHLFNEPPIEPMYKYILNSNTSHTMTL